MAKFMTLDELLNAPSYKAQQERERAELERFASHPDKMRRVAEERQRYAAGIGVEKLVPCKECKEPSSVNEDGVCADCADDTDEDAES